MSCRVSQLVRACGGTLVNRADQDIEITTLLIDSRQLRLPGESVFFAFKGIRQNGHRFIADLYARGVRVFIISEHIETEAYPKAAIILVDDVLEALQHIVQMHRTQYDMPIIGITGSNGKTVVKEWMHQLLGDELVVTKNPKSYNSQLGVALSVWLLNERTELGIFEAGISRPGEMARLQKMIQPTVGVFTNIGTAHDEGFENRKQKISEKLALFKDVEMLIYSLDHDPINEAINALACQKMSWSRYDETADLYIKVADSNLRGCQIKFEFGHRSGSFGLPFTDAASIENAIHCLALLLVMQKATANVLAKFLELVPITMRLEVREGIQQSIIINDTYNADLESLGIALAFATQQAGNRKKTLIVSDFEQQSKNDQSNHRRMAELIAGTNIDRVLGIGPKISRLRAHLVEAIEFIPYATTDQLLQEMVNLDFDHHLVLLKGARSYQLEKVANYLTRQKHNTILEINLGALARNLKVFESRIDPSTMLMVMVKANAYGSGSLEIVKFLQSRNVDYLAVAYADEGVELRNHQCHLPIMVLNPEEESIPLLTEYDLEPEVYSLTQLQQIISHLRAVGSKLPVHIKLETGMHRLGFSMDALRKLAAILNDHPQILVKSLFSHLATSDDKQEHAFARDQLQRFREMTQVLMSACKIKPLLHILNSNGIYHFPDAQFDMVRLGIGLYGIGMPADMSLEKVHTLRTRISQLQEVLPGESIGYGRSETCDQPTVIATIGVGYADGLIRKAGNRRYALVIDDQAAPIVGNVCMDMTMLDVTGIKGLKVGDPVTVFGEDTPIEALAKAADTIPYEILTSLSARIKRIYIND